MNKILFHTVDDRWYCSLHLEVRGMKFSRYLNAAGKWVKGGPKYFDTEQEARDHAAKYHADTLEVPLVLAPEYESKVEFQLMYQKGLRDDMEQDLQDRIYGKVED